MGGGAGRTCTCAQLPDMLDQLTCTMVAVAAQVLYKVYESAELQPYLDAANAEKEAGAAAS